MPSTYAYYRRPLDPPGPDPDAQLHGTRARLGVADPAARSDPEAHLTRALAALGITPAAVFSDDADALTVPLLQRPGVAPLLARLAPGDTLVTSVWSFAGALDLACSVAEVLQLGASVVALDPRGRPLPGDARRVALCALAVAGLGREDHAKATRAGIRRNKAAGLRHSNFAPYGMRWRRGRLVPDENEAAVFARIARLRRAGLSCEKIALQLLREKVTAPTGREYSEARVRRVLLSRWGAIDPSGR